MGGKRKAEERRAMEAEKRNNRCMVCGRGGGHGRHDADHKGNVPQHTVLQS